ncbi:rab11 family-interacting protein 4 isoform X2 [Cephus cinctus]|uniref:Rab11 family-interacting protein 4 isoform X2 n=1 Tax=Cephus cinctus TaxID=211228 RepID=A0AAJ7BKU3_CEPCN|nr:rab11 family-interacting protein 4 isoform X2 [Cephus cinctus]
MVSSRSPAVTVSHTTVSTSAAVSNNSVVPDINTTSDANGDLTSNGDDNQNDGINLGRVAGEWNQSGPSSLSMSVDVHGSVTSNLAETGSYTDTLGQEHNNIIKVGNEEEESYEGFGYVQVDGDGEEDTESPGGSSSAPSPTGPNPLRNARSPTSTFGKHSWLRSSLRRTPPCTGKKRLSSNALASQLYRSSSFNSSGRGSTCDTTDDMYSDVSLEDDVLDLNHRVQMIQEQMHVLVDTQSVGEERYARAKQENATLQARILMLEEAAKDAETRAEERLQAEQRRHREWASRLERERQLQLENYAIKLQAVEVESSSLRDEVGRLREQMDRARSDRIRLENEREEAKREAELAREAERLALCRANEAHSLLEVAKEEFGARAEDQQRLEELEQQVVKLRARNKSLEESRDELQAAAALQAGRELLMMNPCANDVERGPSLAAELLAGMDQDQMRQALKEQQEVNTQLRAYIDGILLNIVENYPELLEVKQRR